MRKIPLFDIQFDRKEETAVKRVLKSGWLTMGDITREFEERFAEFIGVKHAVAVANGTAALHIAFLALGIGVNDEIICPSLTFVAGANSILYSGATPVFADVVGNDDLNISPADIEKKITNKTRAVEILHYAGIPSDINSIIEVAEKHNLFIVEDCAHALGAGINARKCGSIGDIGCFSFFSNKNMTTAEGGMLTTNNDMLEKKARLLRSHGMTTLTHERYKGNAISYDVVDVGYNYRMDEIRAAIGLVQLKKLKDANEKRRLIAAQYKEQLKDVSEVTIPSNKKSDKTCYHIFPILLESHINRTNFIYYLKDKGIQTSIHYPPIHLFDIYKRHNQIKPKNLSNTEIIAKQVITLPMYPAMRLDDIKYVCEQIKNFLR